MSNYTTREENGRTIVTLGPGAWTMKQVDTLLEQLSKPEVSLTAINGRQKRHILADKQEYSSSPTAVLTLHNLVESAKIGHKMAESANLRNGFDRLLACSQHLAAEKTLSQKQDLSVKTQSEKQPERDILTASAILCRE